MEVLLIIGAFQAAFFAVLVFSKKGKSIADKILAVWLSVFAVHLAFVYYSYQAGPIFYIDYGYLPSGALIIYYTLMYLYTKSLISKENTFKAKWWLHSIPTAIIYMCMIPYAQLPYEEKSDLINQLTTDPYISFIMGLILLFTTIYLVATLMLLKKHKVTMRKMFSYEKGINLNWLRILAFLLILLFIVISGLTAYIYYLEASSPTILPEEQMNLDMQGHLAFVVFVSFLGFFGIKQQVIYANPEQFIDTDKQISTPTNTSDLKNKKPKEKYSKSGLGENKASEIYANLKSLMKENSLSKNEELTLIELSKRLEVHPNHLSQVINEKEGKNFYNYINSIRIKEFIKLTSLPENKKYTMISLAYDCGFSSKSTFNKHFKLCTGKTPTEFLRPMPFKSKIFR